MADEADAGNDRAEIILSDLIAEHRYQHAKQQARDIEAETCGGCQYATKSNWGGKCEAWIECRSDIARKEAADKRGGK